jgi:hypothetical protein
MLYNDKTIQQEESNMPEDKETKAAAPGVKATESPVKPANTEQEADAGKSGVVTGEKTQSATAQNLPLPKLGDNPKTGS